MKFIKKWLILMSLLFPLLWNQVGANDKFLRVSDIRADMKGIGYTVVSGNKIESFSVRVIGLLKGSGSVKNLILVKVSGRIFNNGGGISAGMSGSPVFIDNKLIGAIGYGFSNADPTYGLVTPIEDMLRIWSYPERASLQLQEEQFVFFAGGLDSYQGVAFGESKGINLNELGLESVQDKWLQARPVATPLLVSGLGERAYNYLYPSLAQGNLTPIFTGLSSGPRGRRNEEIRLEPGSAISVTLVDGDYEVKSLGTLTWIENGRFLAFGHPFLNRGLVEYGFGGAEILDIVNSNVFPFKIGIGYSPVGRVTQDRGAGISGSLGSTPEFIEVSVSVREQARGRTKRDNYSFRVIQDEQLSPGLILAGVMDAVDRRLDRVGPGTAKVNLRVEGDNISTIERQNLYYGPDIAVASLYELGRLLQLLSGNEFLPIKLTTVSVGMEITPHRLSAKLIKTEISKKQFLPGEEFILRQKLLPYRGEELEIPLHIKLPNSITPGKWILSVHGTGYNSLLKNNSDNAQDEADIDLWKTITSMEQLILEFLSKPANNQLVVEAFPIDQKIEEAGEDLEDEELFAQGMDPEEAFMFSEKPPETHVWTENTKYFLTGEDQVIITVLDPENEDDKGTEDNEDIEDIEGEEEAEK